MRIGIISPYSLTLPGGVQGQILGLGRTLRGMGHDVRVLGPCDGPPPDAGVTPLGNSVPTAANGSVAPIAPDPSAQLRTIRALRDEAFDVVHLHEPLAPGPTQTAMFFKTAPLVGTFHAAGESAAYKWFSPGVKWLAKRLDVRVAVSEDAEKMARAALGGTYTVLFNGVEVPTFAKATPWVDPPEVVRGTAATGPVILFIGRHEPRKGLAVLLEAMSDLPPDVRLWIASDGPDTEALKACVAGDTRIEWLGRISDDEKARRLRAADVFCAPSLRGESFGVVLLEAMAAETPVVASDLPGYSNVARSGRDALLVPPGDARALADALRRVLTDPTCAAELVASGEQRAGHFSMERLAEAYVSLYERVAGGTPSRKGRSYDDAMIFVIVLVVILVLLVGFLVVTYNGLVSLRNRIDAAWAQIDVQLKRRFDLIPNLVETVKGYAAHEQGTFEKVTQARNMAMNAQGPAEAAQADNVLSGALKSLFAVSEAYPDLKANQNFLNLQEELTGTEDKISYARQFYNDTVYKYNTKIQSVPANLIAGPFHFEKREYFEADDDSRGPVKVSF